MKKYIVITLSILIVTGFVGCASMDPTGISQLVEINKVNKDSAVMQQQLKITTKFNSNPDTDAWYDQRQKMMQAKGDRVFDKDFARVFDSLVLAISSMELKVNNMERPSGYIAASGVTLPPSDARTMRRESVTDWCNQNGFDAKILDQKFTSRTMQQQSGAALDMSEMMAKYDKMQRSLTFQLVKMGGQPDQGKIAFFRRVLPRRSRNILQKWSGKPLTNKSLSTKPSKIKSKSGNKPHRAFHKYHGNSNHPCCDYSAY